jgi:hypothetical protein
MSDTSDADSAEVIGTDSSIDSSGDASDNELYHGYSVDDETQPQDTGDSLVDDRGLAEPLDEGYSPPEKWSAGQKWGNTPLEEELGETLEQRLPQEVPEPDPYAEAGRYDDSTAGDDADDDGMDERIEDEFDAGLVSEVGDERAGRLVAPDEGVRLDTEKALDAQDVGIDGAGAGAEEAAVHVIDDEEV